MNNSIPNKFKNKIEELLSDRKKFQDYVYTPHTEAMFELKRRWEDKNIKDITPLLSIFRDGFKAVLHRQLVTPNYEVNRFVSIVDALELKPILFEYNFDKFVTENEWKYHLGCMHFNYGFGKKGGLKLERLKIIEFNKANGKKISDIKTIWDEKLIDFHHDLFHNRFPQLKGSIFDGSEWYLMNGGNAKSYYKPFLSFFIKHGILFENFLLDSKEVSFSREVFLPAFLQIEEETGLKPLIVALEPTDIEEDIFWMCHHPDGKVKIMDKIAKN